MDKLRIEKAQKRFKDRVFEKINDYLLTEPNEDYAICRLYFKKGEEEQTKVIRYYKPVDDPDEPKINLQSSAEFLKKAVCPKCHAFLSLIDSYSLEAVPLAYCPYCGADTFQLSFIEFIKNVYIGLDCPEGDLISDIISDKDFPRTNNYNVILNYLIRKNACRECIETFKKCWKEYKWQN